MRAGAWRGRWRHVLLVLALSLLFLVAPAPTDRATTLPLHPRPAAAMHAVSAEDLGLRTQVVSEHFLIRAQRDTTAERARDLAETAWTRLAPSFPTLPAGPITITIVEDADVYERIQPAPMTRGFATFGGTHVYLRGDQMDQEVTTHELTHILLGLVVPRDLWIPDWFNEGLAQHLSGTRPDPLELVYYSSAQDLLSLPELNRVDALQSPNRELATLQGLAVVSFLVDSYGEDRLAELIDRLSSADSFNQALLSTYGLTDLQLNEEWAAYAEDNYSLTSPTMLRLAGFLAVAGLATLAAVVTFARRARRLADDSGPPLSWHEIEAAEKLEPAVGLPPAVDWSLSSREETEDPPDGGDGGFDRPRGAS